VIEIRLAANDCLTGTHALGRAAPHLATLRRIAVNLYQLGIINISTKSFFHSGQVSFMAIGCELHAVG